MPGFTTSFLFLDINVWLALSYDGHQHHLVANDWHESLDDDVRLCFCRHTQLGLLRLLTSETVMAEDALTQPEAWAVYDGWLQDDRVSLVEEPHGMERRFRALSRLRRAAPKTWADAYLAAFAETSQMSLVTFDRAFRGKLRSLILLAE